MTKHDFTPLPRRNLFAPKTPPAPQKAEAPEKRARVEVARRAIAEPHSAKTVACPVRLTPEDAEALDRLRKQIEDGVTRSEAIRWLIRNHA